MIVIIDLWRKKGYNVAMYDAVGEEIAIKPYKELTIRDDFVFHHVMSIDYIAREVLKVVVPSPIDIGAIEVVDSEVVIDNGVDVKGIRTDVLIRGEKAICDLEMQNRIEGEEMLRARYYSAAIDTQYLKKGSPYSDLLDVFIIFFFIKPLYKSRLHLYTITPECKEDSSINASDGITKLFYDCSQWRKIKDKELCALLEYIDCGRVHSPLARMIDNEVQKLLASAKGEKIYMDAMMRLQEYQRRGILLDKERVARDMISDGGYTMPQIVKISALPQDRIEAIRTKMGL